MSNQAGPILEAREVTKEFARRSGSRGTARALDSVSLQVRSGETVGIVGESGSGKTTLSRLLLGIDRPSEGSVLFKGIPLDRLDKSGRRGFRHAIGAVFQNPYGSFDPRMRIWQLITEQLAIEHSATRAERHTRATQMLERVGLDGGLATRFPHQLSGGQRQRVAIARALVSNPEVLMLDEPLSALDVSVRAQISNLLLDLQESLRLTYVFIAHDLAIVQHLCHRTVVMYRGRIVEEGETVAMFAKPAHPYTAALIEASYLKEGHLRDEMKRLDESQEEPPLAGCIYQPRCPIATTHCVEVAPSYRDLGKGHVALCHYPMGLSDQTDRDRLPESGGTGQTGVRGLAG
jgi:oligopeptide/dipeptide ABC transporter ATP-binding protein